MPQKATGTVSIFVTTVMAISETMWKKINILMTKK